MAEAKQYNIDINGVQHTVRLTDEQAARRGVSESNLVEQPKREKRKYTKRTDAKQAQAPLNKQAEAPTKEG